MIKKRHHQQPFDPPTYREWAEFALNESEQQFNKQNIEFISLTNEYFALNEELKESLRRIHSMNEDLMSAKIKADESDKLKSAFLANIFHEIRTPMNAIIGFSDLLMNAELPKVKTEQFLQIINASCRQLLTVITDIVDISKIEANQITVDNELININHLLEDIFITYKKQVCSNIKLIYSAKPELNHIESETDLTKIKQVFNILLKNAIKFTKQGEIEFGFEVKKNNLEFYVKDSGIGISLKNQAIIFDRFRQAENTNARLYGGNGLGLTIAKALVEKLGGTIKVDSTLKKGSTFTFTLPYVHKSNLAENDNKIPEVHPLVNWSGKSILIVEDETFNHAYIEQVLSFTNAQIYHAWNGKKAIEMVENHPAISLVLMDIKMPVINGYEATRRIKGANPKLPVIAMTAYALSHDKIQALQAGCDNYIAKPIPKDLLVEIIGGYLN